MLFFLVALVKLLVKAELLYDVSFSSDKFSDGAILVGDDTIHTPDMVDGPIEIVHGYDGQDGNWARLDSNGVCIEPGFGLIFENLDSRTIYLEVDIYYEQEGYNSKLDIYIYPGILLWVSDMKLKKFSSDDDVNVKVIADLKERTRHHLEVFASFEINHSYVTLDGKNVSSGTLENKHKGEDILIKDIFIYAHWASEDAEPCDDTVAVSNIKISNVSLEQPEPELGMLQPSIQITKRDEIPAEGGRIIYDAAIKSTYANSDKDFIFYLSITLPSGHQYPVKRRHKKTLSASTVFNASRAAKIPGWIPAGSYQLTLVVINAENGDITNATSAFVKL